MSKKDVIMDLALPEYRQKLVSKIIAADSRDEVRRFIGAAVKTFLARRVNGYIVERFMEKLTAELQERLKENEVLSSENNLSYAIRLLKPVKSD